MLYDQKPVVILTLVSKEITADWMQVICWTCDELEDQYFSARTDDINFGSQSVPRKMPAQGLPAYA